MAEIKASNEPKNLTNGPITYNLSQFTYGGAEFTLRHRDQNDSWKENIHLVFKVRRMGVGQCDIMHLSNLVIREIRLMGNLGTHLACKKLIRNLVDMAEKSNPLPGLQKPQKCILFQSSLFFILYK